MHQPKRTILLMVEGDSEEVYFGRVARISDEYSIITKVSKDKRCEDIIRNCSEAAERLGLDEDDPRVAVFDLDVVEREELDRAVALAREKRVILMASNLSFEIWLLMHMGDVSKVYTQEDYEDRLSSMLGSRYRKSRGLKDKVNAESIKDAIKRGKKSLPDADPLTCLMTPNSSTLWDLLEDIMG